ncbi:unnamed protein product [Blumeria hordei]|uniref:Uncharacterized protein n=1 Tax=Blumeria hordei TaxID=2867405 RepID=A0A383UW71_BLUHO|nr:unnamed protein product [Blumeria hordei]
MLLPGPTCFLARRYKLVFGTRRNLNPCVILHYYWSTQRLSVHPPIALSPLLDPT